MAKTSGPRLGMTRWSAGTDAVSRTDFDGDNADIDANVMLFKQGTLAARPAAGTSGGGRIYTVVGDGTAENNRKQFYDTGSTWITAGSYGNDVLNESSAAGNPALVARGVSGQTADIFAVRNVGLTNLFRVTQDGIATNQATVGTSPGGYLGSASGHLAAGLFNSVATNKPVLVAKAMTGQTSSILSIQDEAGASLFKVDPGGSANLTGALTVASATVTGALNVGSINNTGGAVTLKNIVATPNTASDTPLIARGAASQTGNLFAAQDNTSVNVLRVTPNGSLATSGKVKIGNGAGADTGTYASTVPALLVSGEGLEASTPAARFVGGSGSTGNIFEIKTSTDILKYWINNVGNSGQSGNSAALSGYFGANNLTPVQLFGTSYTPRFEVLTGTEVADFDDQVVLRHTATGTGSFNRRVGVAFKLGDESSSAQSNLMAAVGVQSISPSSANPLMYFRVAGTDVATLDSAGNFSSTNRLGVSPSTTGEKLRLYGTTEAYSLGVQTSSMYFRSGASFSWYRNGVFATGLKDPGAGGALLMDLDSTGRLSSDRGSFDNSSSGSNKDTALRLGPLTATHLQAASNTIDSYTTSANSVNATLYMQFFGTGGALVLGSSDTQVRLDSRTLWTGGNRCYWGSSVWSAQGGGPIENDWWFDYSNNQIKVRNADGIWKIVGDDAWAT